jgi:hypothetical protein
LRPFHHQIGASSGDRQGECRRRSVQRVPEATADGMRHRYVRNDALAKEALFPSKAAINELIDNDEMAGWQFRLQAPHCGQGQHIGDPGSLQCINIGAIVQVRWRRRMSSAVARQKDALDTREAPEKQFIGRTAPRRLYASPALVLQPVNIVEAGTANYTDCGLNPEISGRRTRPFVLWRK